jgi:hypothetical protein
MNQRRVQLLFISLLAAGLALTGPRAFAAPPGFTLTASNVTMSANGSNSVPWTATSVDGFSSSIVIGCSPVNTPAGATLPICGGGGPVMSYTLAANATVQGNIPLSATFCSPSGPCPEAARFSRPRHHGVAQGLALAGALLLGFGLRRRKALWRAWMLLVLGMFAGMAGISGCGAGKTLTPGTWPYTVSASAYNTTGVSTPPITTTVNVTVPPGIRVQTY